MEYKNALWFLTTIVLVLVIISIEITVVVSSQTSFNTTVDSASNILSPSLIEYDGKTVDGYIVRDIVKRFPDNILISCNIDLNKRYILKVTGARGAQQIKIEEVVTNV